MLTGNIFKLYCFVLSDTKNNRKGEIGILNHDMTGYVNRQIKMFKENLADTSIIRAGTPFFFSGNFTGPNFFCL